VTFYRNYTESENIGQYLAVSLLDKNSAEQHT